MEKEGIVFRIGARGCAGRSMMVSLVEACAAKLVSEDEKVATKSIWVSVRQQDMFITSQRQPMPKSTWPIRTPNSRLTQRSDCGNFDLKLLAIMYEGKGEICGEIRGAPKEGVNVCSFLGLWLLSSQSVKCQLFNCLIVWIVC